ncbi:MAG: CoB--CoM heterodisulfide reductase iron-sulfur subunit B family protein [Candidatus Thorarchaeota archaeon]|nr:CoB--CoM heterodisulfide reductase iron-sulfur subunit B family protein [Candidatus Thorarchaeota archaeon]
MTELILYRGCTTPVRLPAYEAATIAVLEKLGVKIHEMKDANCCGAQYIESLSRQAYAAMSGRILALAEEEGKDILALCGACSGSLKLNKHYLDENPEAKAELNELLAEEGLRYTGKVRVRHLLQVLAEDIGFPAIEAAIVRPYSGIKMAAHYGCHVTRPYEIVQVDDPENPTILDRLVELTGATAVDYAGKTRCCGGPLLAMDPDTAGLIGLEKIKHVIEAGADGIVTACVFCDIQLTQVQFGENSQVQKKVPVIPITQFLGPALGIEEEKLGLGMNKISPYGLFAKQEAKA